MEFDRNPDIDEKPPMSLEEALQKAKPFLMAYEGIKSQEEWEVSFYFLCVVFSGQVLDLVKPQKTSLILEPCLPYF